MLNFQTTFKRQENIKKIYFTPFLFVSVHLRKLVGFFFTFKGSAPKFEPWTYWLPLCRARICKRLRSPGIVSEELIPPAYIACQPTGWRNRFLGSLNVYKYRLCNVRCSIEYETDYSVLPISSTDYSKLPKSGIFSVFIARNSTDYSLLTGRYVIPRPTQPPTRVSTEFRRHGIPRNFLTSEVISAQFRRNSAKFRGIEPEITSVFRGMPKCHFRGHPTPHTPTHLLGT